MIFCRCLALVRMCEHPLSSTVLCVMPGCTQTNGHSAVQSLWNVRPQSLPDPRTELSIVEREFRPSAETRVTIEMLFPVPLETLQYSTALVVCQQAPNRQAGTLGLGQYTVHLAKPRGEVLHSKAALRVCVQHRTGRLARSCCI
eukprot:TRINITY_DN4358_c0_g1_i1.p1 TRINITY_DN4358_c0_g1~~TRINITY_DN4358_c0_g1_i1.p1  ORF type:complete len:144 (+),score=5.87 TRINITY_DN4358_c0_g1_i1:353-784(+)